MFIDLTKKVIGTSKNIGYSSIERLVESLILKVKGDPKDDSPQLFILGLPRSGTTLVYQYIVHRTHVAYFTNGVGNYPVCPCTTVLIQKMSNLPYHSDFKSHYGKVSGSMSPREAGSFWGWFFDLNAYQDLDNMDLKTVERLRRTVSCIQALFDGAPFVNKNVKHMLRIDALSKIFSKSHFLVIERDIKDVGISLLRGRKDLFGDYSSWLSVQPKNYEQLKGLDPVDQVVGQIKELRACMNKDLNKLDQKRVHRISYEEFCKNPDYVIDLIPEVFNNVKKKNGEVISFQVQKEIASNEMELRVLDRLNRIKEHVILGQCDCER